MKLTSLIRSRNLHKQIIREHQKERNYHNRVIARMKKELGKIEQAIKDFPK